MRISRQYPRK